MIRHLFKLVWNRKRASALLILEIFFSFLVVFAVSTLGLYLWDSYRRPLGFDYRDVWRVSVDMKQASDDDWDPVQVETFARLLREAQALAPVESAAGAFIVPYEFGDSTGVWTIRKKEVATGVNEVTPELAEVLRLEMAAGRWFQRGDEALGWLPVVIDRDFARTVFGDEDPVGQRLFEANPREGRPETRVVGVISDFRKGGELSGTGNYLFELKRLGDPRERPPRNLLLRLRPGTPASFETELVDRLQRVAPQWSFEVQPLAQMRESSFRLRLMPLLAGGVVAAFLLIMVALGLIGVLWQNLLQRTREFGLRRATGATGPQVRRQILMEQLFLTGLGLLLGTVLVVQLPILDLAGFLSPEVFTAGLLTTLAAMLLLTLACAVYPSRMTSRIPPAEALRYE